MARGRIIENSISNSRKVNSISDRCALQFTWSISHTDDFGRLEGDAEDLLFLVVPRRGWTADEVESLAREAWNAGLYKAYMVDGKRFLEVVDFDKYQTFRSDRNRVAKCPIPTEYMDAWYTSDTPVTPSIKQPDREVKLSEEKRREGKRISSPISSVDAETQENDIYDDDRFKFFWKEFPRKTGKGDAWKAWKKLKPSDKVAREIVVSVREHVAKNKDWKRDGGKYIPHPATFLNGRRFDDEVDGVGKQAGSGKFDKVGKTI